MKTLRELFTKYSPDGKCGDFFDSVREYTVRRSNERKEFFEIDVKLDSTVPKSVIYEAEEGIRDAYEGLYLVRFVPKYPTSLFGYDYIKELIAETERVGGLARGFFTDCDYSLDGDTLSITIRFGQGGVDFLTLGKTESLMARTVKNEFGVSIKVEIKESDDALSYFESEAAKSFKAELDRKCKQALESYNPNEKQHSDEAEADAPTDDKPDLARLWSPYDENAIAIVEDGVCTIGSAVFDISAPEYFYGEEFKITPDSISTLRANKRGAVILGTVCNCKSEDRFKGKFLVTFGLFDSNATMLVRFPFCSEEEAGEIAGQFPNGKCLAAYGDVKRDVKSGDMYLEPKSFAVIKKFGRKDTAPEKRVELHLHTNMSAMDALIAPDAAIKTAMKWGHRAVAITDHGNVQGFPDAMLTLDKIYGRDCEIPEEERFKVLYGMEAYFVNDTASPLYGKYDGDFDNETVVFDLETTGLSAKTCKIIEIGAVKVKDGKVIERFSTFVDPETPISDEITRLTSITNEDVAGAPKIEEILPKFLDFIDGCLLVAHNADFDTSFIRAECTRLGYEFKNPYLDTVGLSRFLNTDLKSHKLDVVAKYFGLADFHHHRAVDDANILAEIYFCMVEKMRKFELNTFADMTREVKANADPLKLKPYHLIILVKNKTGLKNLYRLISMSYLNYYHRNPRIPKTQLEKYREGLIIGSACSAGELYSAILDSKSDAELEDIASFYDYLEVQPIANDGYLVAEGTVDSDEALRDINRKICALGEKLGKPVVATSDAHFIDPEDEVYRRILLAGMKFKDADKPTPIFWRTTDQMLEEFSYLGAEKAYEIVVKNSNDIADSIERIRPIPPGTYTPHIEGSDDELREKCWGRARAMYGEDLPELVKSRLETELESIIKHGFAVLYIIAERLVKYSESQGYLVGSRGSVGSSFVATMAGISEVNPLPPHYYCKKCQYNDFSNPNRVGSGFDLPTAYCPVCGEKLEQDGQDIPFETFLGFKGDKSPDIDLNFSGDVQGRVHKFTEELFGAENVFRAGTLGTLADKTAFGFVMKYYESKGQSLCRAEIDRIITCCMGVKRTTGQHPGGIIVVPREYEVYDFTPVQHPADDPKSDIVTTHFAFSYLHDTILKLDELGHDIPTKYKMLEKYSGISVMDVAMNDPSVYAIFESTDSLGIPQMDREDRKTKLLGLSVGTLGLPEFGTNFIQGVLMDAKPKNFADLMQISGLTHGTDVWLGNAQDLIKDGVCTISEVVGTRDGIMLDLIRYGVDKLLSFKIMEFVRKNKKGIRIPDEMQDAMHAVGVPQWYIDSLQKIKYMFPKAHAAAYVMSAIRLAWYKVHEPVAFYCAILTVAPDGFDGQIVSRGRDYILAEMQRIENLGKEATQKDKATFSALQLANEAIMRGIRFLPVSLKRSDAREFLPEGENIRMPLSSLPGLGVNAAISIAQARDEEPFFSVEDVRERAKVNKSVMEILRANGAFDGLSETDQISMFDLF